MMHHSRRYYSLFSDPVLSFTYVACFQSILSYMSDLYLIGTAARVAGMKYGVKGPKGRGMMVSTTVHFVQCWYMLLIFAL